MRFNCPAILLLSVVSAGETPQIEPAGLRLSRPLPTAEGAAPVPPAFGVSGCSLALLIRLPAAKLTAFDATRSVLAAFTDDRGRDLRGDPEARHPLPTLAVDFLAEGGDTAVVVLNAPLPPGPEAAAVRVRGTLRFVTGGTPTPVRLPAPALAAGTILSAGPVRYTIVSWGLSEWLSGGQDLVLRTGDDEQPIAGFRFLAPDGTALAPQHYRGAARPGQAAERIFAFTGQPTGFDIEITWRRDLAAVDVPFDLAVGLDLGALKPTPPGR